MVPTRWDTETAGGPSGQAGMDERASTARLGLLRYPAAVLGRPNDNIAEVRHALVELNDLRPDLADILAPLSLTKCPSGSNRSGLDSGLRQYSRQRSLSSRFALSFRDLGEFLSVKSDIPYPLFRASQFCH